MAQGRKNIFRILTITWSLLALVGTMYAGNSRAVLSDIELKMNVIPFNGAELADIRLLTYGLFILGAFFTIRAPFISSILLLLGFLGRCYLEAESSLIIVQHTFGGLKLLLISVLPITIFYVCGFIAPYFLLLSTIKTALANKALHPTSDIVSA